MYATLFADSESILMNNCGVYLKIAISSMYHSPNVFFILRWLQEMEGSRLKMVQAADPNFMQTIERAIRVGDSVLLQVGLEII